MYCCWHHNTSTRRTSRWHHGRGLHASPHDQQLHIAGVAVAQLHRARGGGLQRRVLVRRRHEVLQLAAVGRLQLALRHRGGGPVALAAGNSGCCAGCCTVDPSPATRIRVIAAVAAKRMLLSVQIQSTTAGLPAIPMAQTYKYRAAPDSQLVPG
jgi:hypothetical protein